MQKFILEDTFFSVVKEIEKILPETELALMGVVDAQATVIKGGKRISGNRTFEVFSPSLLHEVLMINPEAGIVPPVRIYVFEENSRAVIMYEEAETLFFRYGMEEIGKKIDLMVKELLERVFSGRNVKRMRQNIASTE